MVIHPSVCVCDFVPLLIKTLIRLEYALAQPLSDSLEPRHPYKAAISKYRETSKFMKKTGITAQLYFGTKKKKRNSCSFFIIGIFHVLFEDCAVTC